MMKRINALSVFITLTCVCLAGCRTPNTAVSELQTRVIYRDSTREILRDTTIYVPIEKIVNNNVLPNTDTSTLENKFAISKAFVAAGLLHHSLEQKEGELPFNIKYIDRVKWLRYDSLIYLTKVEYLPLELTKRQAAEIYLGRIFFVILLICFAFGGYKLIRFLKK